MLTQIVRSQSLWMQVAWVLKLKAEDFVIRTLKPLGWYVGLREVNQKENQFWPYFRCMLRFKISLELPWMWDVFLTQVHVFYWLCVCVCVLWNTVLSVSCNIKKGSFPYSHSHVWPWGKLSVTWYSGFWGQLFSYDSVCSLLAPFLVCVAAILTSHV